MKTLIKEITNINIQGVSFKLTEKATMAGSLMTDQWYVSWGTIGKALFKDQYSDSSSVVDLMIELGESALEKEVK